MSIGGTKEPSRYNETRKIKKETSLNLLVMNICLNQCWFAPGLNSTMYLEIGN